MNIEKEKVEYHYDASSEKGKAKVIEKGKWASLTNPNSTSKKLKKKQSTII